MRHKALNYIIASQVVFLLAIGACFIIEPSLFAKNSSLSYYGNLRATIIPYSIGILGAAFCLIKASRFLPHYEKFNFLREGLLILAIFLGFVLVTPFTVNWPVAITHLAAAAGLYLTEIILSVNLILIAKLNWVYKVLLVANIGILVCAVLSLGQIDVLHILALSELLSSVIFTVIFISGLKKLLTLTSNQR